MAPSILRMLLACTLLAACACSTSAQAVGPARASGIGYQIHSQNDLREWRQTFSKGATWLKVDFNYQPPAFCQNPAPAVARVDPETSDRGCFLLNHDTPSLARASPYNTSSDILLWLNEHPDLLHDVDGVKIALCMKFNGNICDGSAASENATALFDAFFTAAGELQQTYPQVEFVLDGALAPSPACLHEKWRPWNSTYIRSGGPAGAYTSNDETQGFERFQINNMQWLTDFPGELLDGYGKFATQGIDPGYSVVYPYLIWEPADQTTLGVESGGYLSGHRHLMPDSTSPGLRFATNSDPVQTQIYTGISGGAWNLPFANRSTDVRPRVAVWSGDMMPLAYSSPAVPSLLLTLHYDSSTTPGRFLAQRNQFAWALASPYVMDDAPLPILLDEQMTVALSTGRLSGMGSLPAMKLIAQAGQGSLGAGASVLAPLILADDSGYVQLVDATQLSFLPANSLWNTSLPSSGFSSVSAAFVAALPDVDGFYPLDGLSLLQATAGAPCTLVVNYYIVEADFHAHLLGTTSCLGSPTMVIDPASVSIALAPNSDSPSCGSLPIGLAFASYLVSFSSAGTAYVAFGCLGMGAKGLVNAASVPVAVGPGSSTSVAMRQRPFVGSPYAMLSITDSFCWNNEYVNKRPDIALCDTQPNNQSQVLTYSFGQMAAFATFLESQQPLSPCLDVLGFVHGTYDMGSQSSLALYLAPEDEQATQAYDPTTWTINVVEVHKGFVNPSATDAGVAEEREDVDSVEVNEDRRSNVVITPRPAGMAAPSPTLSSLRHHTRAKKTVQPPVPASACGPPLPFAGLVMDSWLLPTLTPQARSQEP
jgi:hypothetical protein